MKTEKMDRESVENSSLMSLLEKNRGRILIPFKARENLYLFDSSFKKNLLLAKFEGRRFTISGTFPFNPFFSVN